MLGSQRQRLFRTGGLLSPCSKLTAEVLEILTGVKIPSAGWRRCLSSIPVTCAGAYARDAGVEGSHLYATKWHKELGPIFRDYDLGAIFMSDTSMVEQVVAGREKYPKLFIPESWRLHAQIYGQQRGLMFKEGEEWWQARKQVNPLLLKSVSLAGMHQILDTDIEKLLQVFKEGKSSLDERDIYRWLVQSMIRIFIGDILHSTKESTAEIADQVISDARGIFDSTAALMIVDVQQEAKRESADWVKFCNHTNSIIKLFNDLMRQSGDNLGGVAGKLLKGGMDRDEIEKIVADLMLGGMDTTAITSQWIIYSLASNPAVQDQVRDEVRRVCGDKKSRCEMTGELHITRGVLKEAMRLYPVAPFLTRIISEPMNVGKYSLPAGAFVAISSYVMGRNPDIFPNPDQIIPDRWNRDNDPRSRHQMALSALPFGHGVRMCVGRRLADLQMLLLVSRIVQEFELSTTDKAEYITRMVGVPRIQPEIKIKPLSLSSRNVKL